MKRLQAWKYELRPNGLQKRLMRRFAGCCRVVFNKALVLQEEQRKHNSQLKNSFLFQNTGANPLILLGVILTEQRFSTG